MSSKPQALTSVGPMRNFSANSKKIATELLDSNDDLVEFNKRLTAYYQQLADTWAIAQKKVNQKMRVWQEEVFGPVLPVVTFKTEEEAINLANDTKFGLGAYVFTNDKERINRLISKLESGMINVNDTNYVIPENPFGGYKQSGLGREHGKFGLHELCQLKLVAKPK